MTKISAQKLNKISISAAKLGQLIIEKANLPSLTEFRLIIGMLNYI
jgi:hypothetical protein